MALPVAIKAFLQMSPYAAMLFAPIGCTHPPPPVPPFLFTQILSPKDIAGSDIMKPKVSRHYMKSLGRKGLIAIIKFTKFKQFLLGTLHLQHNVLHGNSKSMCFVYSYKSMVKCKTVHESGYCT